MTRAFVAKTLGFSGLVPNSMDAVSDRDFVVEFLSAASLIMVHLSRLANEIVLWSTTEFGFLRLDDAWCTGSSIMPQKRNPDPAELVRGKTGRVFGDLMGTLAVIKGLPLTYNSDLQEDKEALFDTVDTVRPALMVMKEMLKSATFDTERLAEAAERGFSAATEVADYLVRRGVPFREAHAIVGQVVKYCEKQGVTFADLSLAEWHSFSMDFREEVLNLISAEGAIKAKRSPGGTAPERVQEQITRGALLLREPSSLNFKAISQRAVALLRRSRHPREGLGAGVAAPLLAAVSICVTTSLGTTLPSRSTYCWVP